MAEDVHGDFRSTMSGLETGLQVMHIATFPLIYCDSNEQVVDILDAPRLLPFDQIPVRHDDKIIGLLRKAECSRTGLVRDCMHPLDETVLISAEMTLLDFIQIEPLDRLVLQGSKIHGIVTRSDLLKLPARLLAFSMVTHIEVLMSTLIRAAGVDEQSWLGYLDQRRRREISDKQKILEHQRSDPDLLVHTYFSDKRIILERLCHSKETVIHELLSEESLHQLKEIQKLRNAVAHTGNVTESQDPIQDFIDHLRKAQAWIDSFPNIPEQFEKNTGNEAIHD